MDVTDRFAALLAQPADVLPLDEAVLLVAAHDHPVDRPAQLARIDELASRCQPASLSGIIDTLFGNEGLQGDEVDYHHPDNSFLDRVLDRRRGLPILLSILTAEVAARCGVCLAPVGMPGHFLLRDCADVDTFIDPYNGGRLIDRDECVRIFNGLHPGKPFQDEYLDPVDHRSVLVRVVTNLVHTYTQRGPLGSLAWTLHLRALLLGGDAWIHVAKVRERTGEWTLAADAWDHVDAADKATAARARTN